MGFEVAAIDRGADKAELAKKLGAHHYIDSAASNPSEALQALGGAALILATASAGKAVAETVRGLRERGRVIVLGATAEPIECRPQTFYSAAGRSKAHSRAIRRPARRR
jgi:propanol-preferring alcohol dehydrogenase